MADRGFRGGRRARQFAFHGSQAQRLAQPIRSPLGQFAQQIAVKLHDALGHLHLPFYV